MTIRNRPKRLEVILVSPQPKAGTVRVGFSFYGIITSMNRLPIIGVLAAVIVVGLFSHLFTVRETQTLDTQKLSVAASFYPLAFFASEIGGDNVDVFTVTPAGAEPHDYEPTVADIIKIQGSRVLLLNGGNFEPWAKRVEQNIDPNRTHVVVVGDGLFASGTADPHLWLSPPVAKQMVDTIAGALTAAGPLHEPDFRANANTLKRKLDELDIAYREGLAHCKAYDIVTSHAAFGYVAAAYGLRQIPIAGLSPDAEPSPRQLADIADFVRTNNIQVIFFENLVSPKLAETVANEIGATTMVLDPLEGLSEHDRMAGEDYFTKMRQNLSNLETALSCTK